MKFEAVHNRRLELLRFALIAAAVLLGALIVAKAAGLVRLKGLAAEVRSLGRQDSDDLQKSLRQDKEIAETLKKKNLFTKKPPKENPIKQVNGILGSDVLIGDKWYKAGDKVGDARILAVRPTEIVVEWEGQRKTLSPMSAAGGGPEPPSMPGGPGRPETPKPPEPGKVEMRARPTEARPAPAAPPTEGDPLAWMGVTLSPKVRAVFLEKWNAMSDEEKTKAKEQWNQIPADQRQQMTNQMEQQM